MFRIQQFRTVMRTGQTSGLVAKLPRLLPVIQQVTYAIRQLADIMVIDV